MQTITTKRLPCTATKPERIVATTTSGEQLVASYEYSDNEIEHARTAQILAVKLGWSGKWIGGGTKDGGFVFVCSESEPVFWIK